MIGFFPIHSKLLGEERCSMTFWTWLTQHKDDSQPYHMLYTYLLNDKNYCRRLLRYHTIYDYLSRSDSSPRCREVFTMAWKEYAEAQSDEWTGRPNKTPSLGKC